MGLSFLLPYTMANATSSVDHQRSTVNTATGKRMHIFSSGWSPLSTFHHDSFVVDGTRYSCVLQYYGVQKARFFEQSPTIVQQLMDTKRCVEMKAIIQAIDVCTPRLGEWVEESLKVMRQGFLAKFQQNPTSRRHILGTGDDQIVYATGFDEYWGIGMGMYDPNVDNSDRWCGQNRLGRIHEEIRDELRAQYGDNGGGGGGGGGSTFTFHQLI